MAIYNAQLKLKEIICINRSRVGKCARGCIPRIIAALVVKTADIVQTVRAFCT